MVRSWADEKNHLPRLRGTRIGRMRADQKKKEMSRFENHLGSVSVKKSSFNPPFITHP